MHGSVNAELNRRGCAPSRGLLALALLLGAPSVLAAGFLVQDAAIDLVEGVYRLDARFETDLSDAALEALENGVPLTVILEIQVLRGRKYLWDKRVASLEARQRVELHPLSRQYLLKNLNSGATRTYPRLEETLAALGNIVDFPMLDGHLLEHGEVYTLRLRARIDIKSLPPAVRPWAYVTSGWRLKSEWHHLPLAHVSRQADAGPP